MIDEELGGRECMKSNSTLGLVILFIEKKNGEGRKIELGAIGYDMSNRYPNADMENAEEYVYQSPRKRCPHIDCIRSDHLKMTEPQK